MKLSDTTLDVLKNFASINQNILFEKGDVIATISPQRTVLAKAKLDDSFPQDFAIYDLNRFLGFISRFNDPKYEFDVGCVNVINGRKKGRYGFADTNVITTPPKKTLEVPTPEINFSMKADDLSEVMGDAAVLGLPEIAVEGDGKVIYLAAVNAADSTSDTSRIPVGETDGTFRMVFKTENFKMMAQDYDVVISKTGISHFDGGKVEYFVAAEKSSTYEG